MLHPAHVLHRFEIRLADVDRGVYTDLDLRIARHPSEDNPYLLTRVLAYCLEYSEGIDSQTIGARRMAEGVIRLVRQERTDG